MGTARHRREVTLQPLSFFNFNLSGNKNLRQQRNTPFSTSLVTWIESPWSWDSKGPLKISRKWRSEVVKSGWEGCEPISMRPDPDWQGSYTISSPGSQSTYTSCSVSAGYFPPGPDIRLLTFQSLAGRTNKHSEVLVSCSDRILWNCMEALQQALSKLIKL